MNADVSIEEDEAVEGWTAKVTSEEVSETEITFTITNTPDASLSVSKEALRNAVARRRLNSISQCCSSDSPRSLVFRRYRMSRIRSISASRSWMTRSFATCGRA